MIDWFSGSIGYDASALELGRFFEVEPGGQIIRERDRWETARGSWESGVQITRGEPTSLMLKASREQGFLCAPKAILRVSGNPSKFLQGHNVAGPSVSMLGPVVQAMCRGFGEGFRPADADNELLPALHRSRVDITTAVDMGSHQAVHDWLKLAGSVTRSRHGRALTSSGTVYWGKNSRRWTLKAYCKHCELKEHTPPNIDLIDDLLEWTRTHLRLELTLRRPELQHRGTLKDEIIWEYANRLEIPAMTQTRDFAQAEITPAERTSLQLWADGHELITGNYCSRATFYRHRRSILEATGLDISMSAKAQVEAEPETLLSIEELARREVIEIPDRIQRSLFGAQI